MNRGPAKNPDLHGNVPENSAVVLLLIDVINDLDFDGSEALLRQTNEDRRGRKRNTSC